MVNAFLVVLTALTVAALSGCASSSPMNAVGPQPALNDKTYVSFDGDEFPYRKWIGRKKTDLVIIGFHGIAGASKDMGNLGEHFRDQLPGAAVYAPEIRGQGSDPDRSRRGDIRDASDWFNDAYTFDRLVKERHPGVPVVWCGESMGSVITLHAVARAAGSGTPCNALILSSPVPKLRKEELPPSKRTLLSIAAFFAPTHRVSLEELSGKDEVRVIRDVVHQDQVATNDYHVSEFTLRLLKTLGGLIDSLPEEAGKIDVPVLLLHGGHDLFARPEDVAEFSSSFRSSPQVDRNHYPESYHLLFYDHQRERVLSDITSWLKDLQGP